MVIDSLSTSLIYLDLRNNAFSQWPSSLRHMDFLFHFYLQNNIVRIILVDAFHGFSNSLKVISVSNNCLVAVSEALEA